MDSPFPVPCGKGAGGTVSDVAFGWYSQKRSGQRFRSIVTSNCSSLQLSQERLAVTFTSLRRFGWCVLAKGWLGTVAVWLHWNANPLNIPRVPQGRGGRDTLPLAPWPGRPESFGSAEVQDLVWKEAEQFSSVQGETHSRWKFSGRKIHAHLCWKRLRGHWDGSGSRKW